MYLSGYTIREIAELEFVCIRAIYYSVSKKTGRHTPGRYESKEFCDCGNKCLPHRNRCRECHNAKQREAWRRRCQK